MHAVSGPPPPPNPVFKSRNGERQTDKGNTGHLSSIGIEWKTKKKSGANVTPHNVMRRINFYRSLVIVRRSFPCVYSGRERDNPTCLELKQRLYCA